ncbi:MAG: thioredoxin domain-containing protein, partial [Anaerolineae bacterium]
MPFPQYSAAHDDVQSLKGQPGGLPDTDFGRAVSQALATLRRLMMRRFFVRTSVVLSLTLTLAFAAGCGGGATPSPSPSPSPMSPTTTAAPDKDATDPPATPTSSGPATCELFTLSPESQIPSVSEEDHVVGPEDAPITFMEYADFQCPACSGLHTLREYLREKYGDQLRFVYRHLPLIGIHDKAIITAEATEAAAAQGKFWDMHDLLYERQQE